MASQMIQASDDPSHLACDTLKKWLKFNLRNDCPVFQKTEV